MVYVYDNESGGIKKIPKAHLDPKFIPVKEQGTNRVYWIDPKQLQIGKYKHPPFDENRLANIREIKSKLDDVYSLSIEQWEDGFRRDTDPDKEISLWLRAAGIYEKHKNSINDPDAKKELFKILLGCMNREPKDALMNVDLVHFSKDEANKVIHEYFIAEN